MLVVCYNSFGRVPERIFLVPERTRKMRSGARPDEKWEASAFLLKMFFKAYILFLNNENWLKFKLNVMSMGSDCISCKTSLLIIYMIMTINYRTLAVQKTKKVRKSKMHEIMKKLFIHHFKNVLPISIFTKQHKIQNNFTDQCISSL